MPLRPIAVGQPCRREAGSGHGLRAAAMPISKEDSIEVAATSEVARAEDKQQWQTPLSPRVRSGGGHGRQRPTARCGREEGRSCGRHGSHLAVLVHTFKSNSKADYLVLQLAFVRMDGYHYYHCQLCSHGSGRQVAKGRQNRPINSDGKLFYIPCMVKE